MVGDSACHQDVAEHCWSHDQVVDHHGVALPMVLLEPAAVRLPRPSPLGTCAREATDAVRSGDGDRA
jgi:hypothetical protein